MIENFLTFQVNDYYVATFFWNIFLALLPCYLAYRLSRKYYLKKWGHIHFIHRFIFIVVFLLWFFFLPNTAYLITDIRHLVNYCDQLDPSLRVCPEQAWMVPLFFIYAAIGIPTFYYALSRMTYVMGKMFGKATRILFPILMTPVTALGLMLGLVGRFNSWNLLTHPLSILHTMFLYLTDATMLLNLSAYTLMLYLVYYSIDFLWKKRQ